MIKTLENGKNNIKAKKAIILFFLFIFLLIVIFLLLAIYTSKLQLEIVNLHIDTKLPKGKKINNDSKINVQISIFNKIKIINKDIKNIKFKNKEMDIKILKNKDMKIDYKELIQKIQIEKINLTIHIGTENAAFTAILVGILAAILGIIIKKPKYEIIPNYSGENFMKIHLNGIFTINLMHYIYSLILNRKRRDENGRTSNRKSYANCYE